MSTDAPPEWTGTVMRAGYASRFLVYLVLGGLTIFAAWTGGEAEGAKGSLEDLRGGTLGVLLLWIISIGLICYAGWRFLAAWYDIEDRGDDEKGLFARVALVVTGLAHLALGVSVAAIASSSSGEGGGDWTTKIFELPFGKVIAAVVGIAIAGAGVHYVLKGYKKKYERHIKVTETTRKLEPVLRFGFLTYGAILGIVGIFLLIAVLRTDPSQAKGIGAALDAVRSVSYGRILLGLFGVGFIAFAVENLIEAIYRISPDTPPDSVESMAEYAKRKADEATA